MAGDDPSATTLPVPGWLNRSAAFGWRFLVIAGTVWVVSWLVIRLRLVVLPLLVALLIAAALHHPVDWLRRREWPPLLATWAVLLAMLGVLVGIGWLIVPGLAGDLAEVGDALGDAYQDVRQWLIEGPLGMTPGTLESIEDQVTSRIGSGDGLLDGATLVFELGAGAILAVVAAFFYVKDRDRITGAVLDAVPGRWRERIGMAIETGWSTLGRYLIGVVVVGSVDAALIGIGLFLIGVPLVVPLMVLTFLGGFFPLVGAVAAGVVATLIALATGGVGDALLVALLATAVQQLDGDVVAPLVYSRAVALHPLVILVALATGGVLGGVMGAFLAVPTVAVVVAIRRRWQDAAAAEAAG